MQNKVEKKPTVDEIKRIHRQKHSLPKTVALYISTATMFISYVPVKYWYLEMVSCISNVFEACTQVA